MSENTSCCRVSVDDNLISNAKDLLKDTTTEIQADAKIFALLGNEVRLSIVNLFLSYEKMCVCDLADVLEMKQSPISQHLRKLKDGAILVSKREGMTIFYSINPSMLTKLIKIIKG